jgi:hypothetical protein
LGDVWPLPALPFLPDEGPSSHHTGAGVVPLAGAAVDAGVGAGVGFAVGTGVGVPVGAVDGAGEALRASVGGAVSTTGLLVEEYVGLAPVGE